MSVKEDKVNLIVTINGDKARKELNNLDAESKKIRESMKGLKKDSEEYIAKSAELKKVEDSMKAIRAEIGLNSKTMRELNQELRALNMVRNNLVPGTEAFKENEKAILRVKTRMSELNDGIKVQGGLLKNIGEEVKKFGILAGSYLGFQFLSSQISGIINKAGKLSDQLADVAKTTGMSSEEVKKLNSELSKIDTRTSTGDLREIAIAAGQLGIAKEDVLGFTEAIDKANVALGDEFTGGAGQVATELGKLRNIFSDVKSDKVDDDLLKIGNALNNLASAGAATGPVVADFANRIGGVGIPLGLTSAQVLGLSATLQELNVTTERGGTAVTKILQKMARDTDQFAKVAGVPAKEFADLVNRDLFGAFQKVLEGSSKSSTGATQLAGILQELGVDGAGASEVIAKLGTNGALLAEKVKLAGDSIQKTDGILAEFYLKNSTLGAELEKLSKRFFAFATNESIRTFLGNQVGNANKFIDALKGIPDWVERNSQSLRILAEVAIAYRFNLIASTAASIANTTAEVARNVQYEIGIRWLMLKDAATKAYAFSTGVLTGQITLATAATQIWNRVLALNPVTAVVASFVALVEVIDLYRKNTSEAIALEKSKMELTTKLDGTQKELNKSYEAYKNQVENLNKLTPIEREELQKTIEAKIKDAEASLLQYETQQKIIQEKSSTVGTWQAIGNSITGYLSAAGAAGAATQSSIDAYKNGAEAGAKYDSKIKELKISIGNLKGENEKLNDVQNAYSNAMKINAVTVEQYNEKLRLLRTALNNSVIGSAEYLKISEEIKRVQDAISGASGPAIDPKAIDEAAKSFAKLQEEIKKLENDMLLDQQGKHEQEITQVKQKYAKLLDEAKGHSEEIKRLKSLETQELAALEKEQSQVIEDLRDQLYFSKLTKDEQEIQSIRDKYQKQIDEFKGFQDKIKELEDLRDAEIEEKTAAQNLKKLQDKQSFEDEVYRLTLSANDQEIYDEANKWDALIMQADQYQIDSTSLIDLKNAAINALAKKQHDTEIKNNNDKNKKLVDSDKKRYDTMLALTRDFSDGFGALLSIVGAKQSAMVDFQKMATVAQIAISTAAAIAKVIEAATSTSLTPIDRAVQIAAGVSQILVGMASAKNFLEKADVPPPQFVDGGKLPGGSVMPGPSVSKDNLFVVDPTSGNIVATVKSGEPVLSEETYRNNKPLVDALLDSSMNKGGMAINPKGYLVGGILDSNLSAPLQPNIEVLSRSIQVQNLGVSAIRGGSMSSGVDPVAPDGSGDGRAIVNIIAERMEASNKALLAQFAEELKQIEVKGVWDYDYYTRTTDTLKKVQDGSKLS